MSALFNQGWFAYTPAWHRGGDVLDYHPDEDEAKERAGHDFTVVERPIEVVGKVGNKAVEGWKALVKGGRKADGTRVDGAGSILGIVKDTYKVLQNQVGYDVARLLCEQGFQHDAGVTLDDGRVCAISLLLNEPFRISGDDSKSLPLGWVKWAHDGSASLDAGFGTIRIVCMNTAQAAEMEAKGLATHFRFRHTKNALIRIEDAKAAIKGARATVEVYRKMAEELATIPVTPEERDLFVSTIIGERDGRENEATASARVLNNIERERAKCNSVFFSRTMPEAHRLTGYGLWLCGTEYFDHLRNFRSQDSYVKRTLLETNPAKANLNRTIREICAAAV